MSGRKQMKKQSISPCCEEAHSDGSTWGRLDVLLAILFFLPVVVLGLLPALPDRYFWCGSVYKYTFPWAAVAGVLFCLLLAAAHRNRWRYGWLSRLEKLLFSSKTGYLAAFIIAGLYLAVFLLVPFKYDLVGDNVCMVKWVYNPLIQDSKQCVPNSLLFRCLLRGWLDDYDRTIYAWRILSRVCIAPYVILSYLLCRQLPYSRLFVLGLMLTSGSVLYNYFGHLDYYAVQILFLLMVLYLLLLFIKNKCGYFLMAAGFIIGAVDYLPIGIVCFLPVVYAGLHRCKAKIHPVLVRSLIFLGVTAGVLILIWVQGKGQFIPIYGTADSMVSVRRAVFWLNHLGFAVPFFPGLIVMFMFRFKVLFSDVWNWGMQRPYPVLAGLLCLPGLLINMVSVYYHGWFDLDNMAVYLTIPLLLLAGMIIPPESGDAGRCGRGRFVIITAALSVQVIFTSGMIIFFNSAKCIPAFMDYVEWNTDLLHGGFAHTGNRIPVLLALDEHEMTADWMERRDTLSFPISLLNWQDVYADFNRNAAKEGADLAVYNRLRANPWFWLLQLQPAYFVESPDCRQYRANLFDMLGRSEKLMPAAARVAYYGFKYMDSVMFGGAGADVPDQQQAVERGMTRALWSYFFKEEPEDASQISMRMFRDDKSPLIVIDIHSKSRSGPSSDPARIDQVFRFYYCFSGANFVSATNLSAAGSSRSVLQ